MKKNIAFLTAIMVLGMLISTAYAKPNSTETSLKQQQGEESTINCGDIYSVSVYEITSEISVKTVRAQYDDETDKIIIDGKSYSWSRNPYYGKEGYGKVSKYKYTVAGYYFNWEYKGNGNFRM
ncbi:MAG: hypothetical protein J5711_07385 [Bacteroidales bacterium]|nr:hypothetical protein [Bacteroidales bacterium]